ncbi:MAG: type II toxin-antitoxin system PemK/MazF family toxin [archaeon]|nr:type II toxin-antitoxin system PemK/MazF family toxin [archaeon]
MKFNYKPTGPSRMNAPKQWEVWLADASFSGAKKRCAVVVGKRSPAGFAVHEVVPLSQKAPKDIIISNLEKAGQDRPGAVRTSVSATIQNADFVQKLGVLANEDISKIISSRQ